MDIYAFCNRGGVTSLGANAIDLSIICTTPNAECKIDATYKDKSIENRNPIEVSQIKLTTSIATFTNYSTITSTENQTFFLDNGNSDSTGKITHFINNGAISGGIRIIGEADMEITNYGLMRGVWTMKPLTITINNLGVIETAQGSYINGYYGNKAAHFILESKEAKLAIQNYFMVIKETQSEFNNFEGYTDKTNNKNSHLIIVYNAYTPTATNIYFKDADSKIILDFGEDFQLGKAYLLNKIITSSEGKSFDGVNVDFSRLALSDERKDIYELVNSGDSFIIRLMNKIQETPITAIYKANIRTMNNFYTMSNAMIYPRKYNFVILRERSDRRISKNISSLRASEYERGNSQNSALDSANHLKSYESFAYRNEAQNRRIQRQNKRNYSRESLKTQNQRSSSLRASEYERGNPQINKEQNYYFILTPFVNHNLFFESGRYNLSGFDYGFLTAFSTQVAESNSLGAHFMMSYGSLGDKQDKDFMIKTLNLNVGINYKLDLVYDMYLKARGDFFYFLNQAKTLTMFEAIKPNNLGFGASVVFGKDFDFKSGGVLGIEAGLDYKALQSSTISLHDNVYQKQLYHLIYADLGVNYNKYFGNFGLNAGLGIKGNITANKLAKSQIHINNLNRSVDMVLDNDNFLGYANIGASYALNARDFDMEFSLAYYGNFGDRIISNAGGFEWRTRW